MPIGSSAAVMRGSTLAVPIDAGDILSATFWLRVEDADLTIGTGDRVSAAVNMGSAGAAMDLSQATDAARPTFIASEVNGKAVLRFDGADYLSTASVEGSEFLTANQNVAFLVINQDGADDGNCIFRWQPDDEGNCFRCFSRFVGDIFFDSANATASSGRISDDEPVGWTDTWHILELVRNGTTAEILVDGTSLVTDATMDADIITSESGQFHLGLLAPPTTVVFTGDLAEIIIASGATAVSSATRTEAREALAAYYGVTLP